MELKINKELTSQYGLTIPSNSIVKFDIEIPESMKEIQCYLHVYENEEQSNLGNEIYPIELKDYKSVVKKLTQQDYESFSLFQATIWMKQMLESIPSIGSGNVTINYNKYI